MEHVIGVPEGHLAVSPFALVLFPRTLGTALGVAKLAQSGLGAQAIMLTRSLFEDMVDLHWASARSDVAADLVPGEILAANKTDAEWTAVESDDGFQRGAWLGGYDTDERAFCFGRKSVPELWCQFELADAPGIARGAVRSLPARLAG